MEVDHVRGVAVAFVAFFAFLFFGTVAGVAFQVGMTVAGATAAGAAPAVYPYYWHPGFFFPFGFLFPLLFLFLIFGLARAAFGSGRGHGSHGMWGDRRARLEELHREMHEKSRTDGTAT